MVKIFLGWGPGLQFWIERIQNVININCMLIVKFLLYSEHPEIDEAIINGFASDFSCRAQEQ